MTGLVGMRRRCRNRGRLGRGRWASEVTAGKLLVEGLGSSKGVFSTLKVERSGIHIQCGNRRTGSAGAERSSRLGNL